MCNGCAIVDNGLCGCDGMAMCCYSDQLAYGDQLACGNQLTYGVQLACGDQFSYGDQLVYSNRIAYRDPLAVPYSLLAHYYPLETCQVAVDIHSDTYQLQQTTSSALTNNAVFA